MNDICIIAEAGVNHNGSVEMAKELIACAAEAKADAVKFQTFKTERVIARHAPKAAYQVQTTDAGESQWDMVKKLELSEAAHQELAAYSKVCGIELLSTPFDSASALFLVRGLGLKRLKVPSGEITNAPFLLELARLGVPLIVSTGMTTLHEVDIALGVLAFGFTRTADERPTPNAFKRARASEEGKAVLENRVTLLHCTTEYPASMSEINLRAMATMREATGIRCGLSDHSTGVSASIAAAALGACVIEKHFTLDRSLPGPDHKASLEPGELVALVRAIREVEAALGTGQKAPAPSELKNRAIARKSLVAATAIRMGAPFTPENLTTKRPGSGIPPMQYWEWLDKKADRDYREDDLIQ